MRPARSAALWLAPCAALSLAPCASAVDVRFDPVAPGIYAHIGDKGARTVENEGLNANIGLIVAPGGAILIDSGATFSSARDIHAAVKRITPLPVKWVINTGGQDHRWLGNSYFAALGAELIAHTRARADMQARGGDQLQALRATLGEKADGTTPMLPTRLIEGRDAVLELGGLKLELRHRGTAHTPGDLMVRVSGQTLGAMPDGKPDGKLDGKPVGAPGGMPEGKRATGVVFSGDVVYVERMLGVIPVSSTRTWLDAFDALAEWNPAIIVPGHGAVTTLAIARRDTRDYLAALRAHMKKAVDDGTDVSAAIKSFPLGDFAKLLVAAEIHPGNASRTYLEMERE